MHFRHCLVLQFIVVNSYPNWTPTLYYNNIMQYNCVLVCWLGGNGRGAAMAPGKQDH